MAHGFHRLGNFLSDQKEGWVMTPVGVEALFMML
jgi:hypothetical protein